MIFKVLVAAALTTVTLPALSGENSITAIHRTNAENYKDRALASCISEAYKGSPAGADSAKTSSALMEWTYFDDEKGNPALDQLISQYLKRDYSNPTEGYAGTEFFLLKCIDMYHSEELDTQVKQFVPHPNWIGDKPKKRS